jgi:soluble lytic murein transglycosylase
MIGDTQMSLRIAKAAIARGQNLIIYGYPVHPFPAYKPLRKPPELAFLLGLARQETEFETQTVSGAGAKGLLQVMTVTAKHVCRDYKIKCDLKRLLPDKAYNASIASAYVADRMDEFDGSYVLGLAGYNAGPGRARQWIRENGDPRDPKVDPLDWIERIPITETREYVTKVMSNIQIYRARLGAESTALRVEEDLVRARRGGKEPATSDIEKRRTTAAGGDG